MLRTLDNFSYLLQTDRGPPCLLNSGLKREASCGGVDLLATAYPPVLFRPSWNLLIHAQVVEMQTS